MASARKNGPRSFPADAIVLRVRSRRDHPWHVATSWADGSWRPFAISDRLSSLCLSTMKGDDKDDEDDDNDESKGIFVFESSFLSFVIRIKAAANIGDSRAKKKKKCNQVHATTSSRGFSALTSECPTFLSGPTPAPRGKPHSGLVSGTGPRLDGRCISPMRGERVSLNREISLVLILLRSIITYLFK